MRPNPTEMLVRIREVLVEVVLPELLPGYAQTQLQFLVLALEDVAKMEDLHPRLLDENDDLEALLGAALEESGGRLTGAVGAVLRDRGNGQRHPSFRETEARNVGLRSALARMIALLARDDEDTPLRARIRTHLRKYLDRDATMGVMVADRK